MRKSIAFIPVRGGSQSIPLKNIKPLSGKPLIYWTMKAAQESEKISDLVIATDHDEIEKIALSFGFSKTRIYRRKPENAVNTSSTESVMLEFLESFGGFQSNQAIDPQDFFVLIQATNPFLKSEDLDRGFQALVDKSADSLLSAVRTKRFFWSEDGRPYNYDFRHRPRRQDFAGMFMENGAFYINSIGNILRDRNRLSGKIAVYEMCEESGFEIDEPSDWIICEELLKKIHSQDFLR